MNLKKCLSVLGLLFVISIMYTWAGDSTKKLKLDPKIQQKINQLGKELASKNMEEAEAKKAILDFREALDCSNGKLLVQAVLALPDEGYGDTTTEKMQFFIGSVLLQNTSDKKIIHALAPALERAQKEKIRRKIAKGLRIVTYPENFAPLFHYLEARKQNSPKQLIRYIFQEDPDVALRKIRKLFKPDTPKPKFDPEKKVTIQDLRSLTSEGKWWQQLYVATKMQQEPDLRNDALIKDLKKSEHKVVQQTIDKLLQDIEQ